MKINILGTEYEILRQNAIENPRIKCADGYCDPYAHKIVVGIPDDDIQNTENLGASVYKVMRHEIVHAFLSESGLQECSSWAGNEECVDWIAKQIPKIVETMKAAGCL